MQSRTGSTTETSEDPTIDRKEEIILTVRLVGEAANAKDVQAMSQLLHDHFIYSSEDGIRLTKAQVLERLPNIPENVHTELERPQIDIHGDQAVARYTMLGNMNTHDREYRGVYRLIHTLIYREGRWQLLESRAYRPTQLHI